MLNNRFVWICCAIVASLIFLGWTALSLPEQVASHFNAAGLVDGYMRRGAYLGSYAMLLILLPLFTYSLAGVMPATLARKGDLSLTIPNQKYWLAIERREETARFFSHHASYLALFLLALFDLLHYQLWQANQLAQPLLHHQNTVFYLTTGVLLIWCLRIYQRFARVKQLESV